MKSKGLWWGPGGLRGAFRRGPGVGLGASGGVLRAFWGVLSGDARGSEHKVVVGGVSGPPGGRLGTVLGPSWGHLGAPWGLPWGLLGPLGVLLGPSGRLLGLSWGLLGRSWTRFGGLNGEVGEIAKTLKETYRFLKVFGP